MARFVFVFLYCCLLSSVYAESGTIQHGATKIFYQREGTENKKTIVFLESLPLSCVEWQCQTRTLSKDFQTIAIDLPGFGHSSPLANYKMKGLSQFYTEQVLYVLKQLKVNKFILVGHATGGHVAMYLAAKHPDKVEKLVLIETSPMFSQAKDWPYGFNESERKKYIVAANTNLDEVLKLMTTAALKEKCDKQKLSILAKKYYKLAKMAGKNTVLSFFENLGLEDFRDLLPQIKAPTLILWPVLSDEIPRDVVFYMAKKIPNSQLVEINGMDHFVTDTNASLVNILISNFVNPKCDICDLKV